MTTAPSRSARQARIAQLIEAQPVTSQTQLAVLLAESGVEVRADVPLETVRRAAGELLATGSPA